MNTNELYDVVRRAIREELNDRHGSGEITNQSKRFLDLASEGTPKIMKMEITKDGELYLTREPNHEYESSDWPYLWRFVLVSDSGMEVLQEKTKTTRAEVLEEFDDIAFDVNNTHSINPRVLKGYGKSGA